MGLVSVEQRLNEIKNIMKHAVYSSTEPTAIVDIRKSDCPAWEEFFGTLLPIGKIVLYKDIKYLTMQSITPIESQPPDGTGMLAIYKPYTDESLKEWIYGEYVEIGWQRMEGDKIYVAIQDPGANITPPSVTYSIWKLVVDGVVDSSPT